MAVGTFVIQELKQLESGGFVNDDQGERFVWTADRTPPDSVVGGARAAPLKPWPMPLKQRTERTDYPGARAPTEQILGPAWQPFTLTGKWDDRYNFAGYAIKELARFEAMVSRGNLVLIQFLSQEFHALITDFVPEYRREWDIGYSFTVSNHGRPQGFDLSSRAPATVRTQDKAVDESAVIAKALASWHQDNAPRVATSGSSVTSVTASLKDLDAHINTIADSIDTRRGVLKPIGDFKKTASLFRIVAADATGILTNLQAVRSDTELSFLTAKGVLDWEAWSHGTRFQTRVLLGQANAAAKDMDERDAPTPVKVYRPFRGQSLYGVSRAVYGTPHGWRDIQQRNHLTGFTLDGTEELIIPERTG